jgi:hypothetical protein
MFIVYSTLYMMYPELLDYRRAAEHTQPLSGDMVTS